VCVVLSKTRVMEEYSIGDGDNPTPNIEIFKRVSNSIDVKLDNELLPYFYYESTSGEIWVISYARQHPEFTCVINETFARNICNLLGLKVTGTIV
jgi:predicted nucleic acid-binding protein